MQETIYFNLYKFLTSKEVFFFRIILFVILTLILLLFFNDLNILVRVCILYFILIIQELFIYFKLEKYIPSKNINSTTPQDAALFDVRAALLSNESAFEVAKNISITKQGKFLTEKVDPEFAVIEINVDKKALLERAASLVRALEKKYITSLDILAAYILLQEENFHTLQKYNLDERDLLTILYWTRKQFKIEHKSKNNSSFHGNGVFDSLIFGWTPETKNYTSDFTSEVMRVGYEPKIIGREKEYRKMVEDLSKNSSNNALIVGEPGVGKTNLVMRFAYDSYKGSLTKSFKYKRVYYLFVDRIMAGASTKGELEKRLVNIFTEIEHSGNILIFIESIENIFGGGGFEYDMSGALQAYLESNRIQIIGTTTPQGYKDFIENKSSILPKFNEIRVDSPDKKISTFMLMEEVELRERLSNIKITYGALKEIVELAEAYSQSLSLPGSAVKLLEDVMVRTFQSGVYQIKSEDVRQLVKEETGINMSSPTKEEKVELLNMEKTMHQEIIGQEEAVSTVSNAIRRLRSGLKKNQGPVASFLFLGPTGVGKTKTAKLLAREYYGNENKLIRLDMSEYQTQDSIKKLLGEMPGEESYDNTFTDQIRQDPTAVLLVDEIEKAHPKLLDIFLQILDEGFVTNNKGNRISFSNSIIVATSNAGSEFIRENNDNVQVKDKLVEHILSQNIFRPEFINRFDDVVIFKTLSNEQVTKITELMLTDLKHRLEEQFLYISFSDSAITKIADESFSEDFGARNVRRYIEEKVENLVSRMILEDKISKGENFLVNLNEVGEFIIEK